MSPSRPVTFADLIGAQGEVPEANAAALGDGWGLAAEFLELHSRALEAVATSAGRNPSAQQRAVMFLGAHTVNTAIAGLGLIARGLFDVVSYLSRTLIDCHSLLMACGHDEAMANRFLDGEEKLAVPARKMFIASLRENGYEEDADWIERRFKSDYDAGNVLSHVGRSQVSRVLQKNENGSVNVVLGATVDPDQALLLWRAVLDQEHWALIALRGACSAVLDEEWLKRFEAAQARLVAFMNAQGREGSESE